MFPLRDDIPSRRVPLVTIILIAINAFVFVQELLSADVNAMIETWGFIPARSLDAFSDGNVLGALTPAISSMFLHGGFAHVIGNLWFLWIFGDNVEDVFGRSGFLGFYLASGLVAAAAQFATDPESIIPMIGASGAVAGVLGAYFVFYPRARVLAFLPIIIIPFFFRLPAVFFLGFWFVEQLLAGGITLGREGGGVAWWAHAGGFAFGALLALPLRERVRQKRQSADWMRRRGS